MPEEVPDLEARGVGRQVVDDAEEVPGGQVGDEPHKNAEGGRHKQGLTRYIVNII